MTWPLSRVVSAQTTRSLAWDDASPSSAQGFAVTVDGVRTDLGTTPLRSDGSCNCSIPLPFSSGRHVVSVTAYNSSAESTSSPFVVGPTANAGGPYTAQAGTTLVVSGAGSTDSTGSISGYVWHWGDGSSDTTSTTPLASHIYAAPGTYAITLTVGDAFPASDSASTTATIGAPAPPGSPGTPNPASGATGLTLTPTLTWTATGGTSFDVAFGTTSPPAGAATALSTASYTPAALSPGTTYYWQIVAHNAGGATTGPIWSFSTADAPSDIVIYASDIPAAAVHGVWSTAADAASPNRIKFSTPIGPANVTANALAAPVDYFDVAFSAPANTLYTLWLRIAATGNSKYTDSLWVQFSDAQVDGTPVYAIGGTSGLLVNLATDGTGASDQGWGWVDGAYWLAQAASVSFATTGPHTMRIQAREYGVMLDQIVLSPTTYFNRSASCPLACQSAPGSLSNDETIVPKVGGAAPPAAPAAPTPADGANGVSTSPTLTWNDPGAVNYDVSFGTTNPPPLVSTAQSTASYTPATLAAGTRYFWQIVARNGGGSTSGPVWSFTTSTAVAPPPTPAAPTPSDGASGVSTTPILSWNASGAAYDVFFGNTNPPPQAASGQTSASYAPGSVSSATTYYWQVVARNAGGSTPGPIWTFTTAAPVPNVVIYASDVPAGSIHGTWSAASDATSPNGVKLATPDNGLAATSTPSASPADYVDIAFEAPANTPYTVWLRVQALDNSKWNDSLWLQFSDAIADGSAVYPINSTFGLLVNLATESTGASDQGWGWVNGAYWMTQTATVSFASSGSHTLRIQAREDGVQFDQIVLSPAAYFNATASCPSSCAAAPGTLSGDHTIVIKQ